jgi:hypothetical protein
VPGATEEGPALAHMRASLAEWRAGEALEPCPVCRETMHGVGVLMEEEVLASRVADHLAHMGLTDFRVRMMAVGERIGLFSVLARFLLRFRGVPR